MGRTSYPPGAGPPLGTGSGRTEQLRTEIDPLPGKAQLRARKPQNRARPAMANLKPRIEKPVGRLAAGRGGGIARRTGEPQPGSPLWKVLRWPIL
jgi:hypothetical protein